MSQQRKIRRRLPRGTDAYGTGVCSRPASPLITVTYTTPEGEQVTETLESGGTTSKAVGNPSGMTYTVAVS